jgi:hypothetical protein
MSQATGTSSQRDARAQTSRSTLLDSLAAQALAQVASRYRASRGDPDGSALDRLYTAAIGADPRACAEVARALIADGLSADRICDVHIPATARRMGEEWVSDDLSFSIVTIGTARLQGLLRELDLGLERRIGHAAAGGRGSVLVVVASEADHTLGALLLASQLRRKGLSVRLSLGENPEAMARANFDAVFLSASIDENMPFLIEAAARIRAAMPAPPPLVLGGALITLRNRDTVEREAQNGPDYGNGNGFAGIDYVTCDLDEAIELCGLTSAP